MQRRTYISKIHSRNLILDHMLSAVPKISFQMIPKNKDPLTGSFSQKLSFFRLNFFESEPGSGLLVEILGQYQYVHISF